MLAEFLKHRVQTQGVYGFTVYVEPQGDQGQLPDFDDELQHMVVPPGPWSPGLLDLHTRNLVHLGATPLPGHYRVAARIKQQGAEFRLGSEPLCLLDFEVRSAKLTLLRLRAKLRRWGAG